jgi:hypothetical protein
MGRMSDPNREGNAVSVRRVLAHQACLGFQGNGPELFPAQLALIILHPKSAHGAKFAAARALPHTVSRVWSAHRLHAVAMQSV